MGLIKNKDNGEENTCDVVYNDCVDKVGSCAIVSYTNELTKSKAKKDSGDDCSCGKNDELFAEVLKLILAKLDNIEKTLIEIKEG